MMERTKKTLLDGLERHGLSALAQTWPDTATAHSQSDRHLFARSGHSHNNVLFNGGNAAHDTMLCGFGCIISS